MFNFKKFARTERERLENEAEAIMEDVPKEDLIQTLVDDMDTNELKEFVRENNGGNQEDS